MRETVKVTTTETKVTCDVCKKESGRIKPCAICGKDICWKCAILTEFEYDLMVKNNYDCDRPDFICEECWDKGLNIRKEITEIRYAKSVREEALFAQWKKEMQDLKQQNLTTQG